MCDIHFQNGVEIIEVGVLSPGNDITTFEVFGVKCGIAICADACFDEFVKLYGLAGRIFFGKKNNLLANIRKILSD